MKQSMTCEDFYDRYFSKDCDEMVQEQFWLKELSTSAMFKAMVEMAKTEDVELTDLESFDDDKFFYNVYQCSEKGLS